MISALTFSLLLAQPAADILLKCPEPFSVDDARAVFGDDFATERPVEIAIDRASLAPAAQTIADLLRDKGVEVERLDAGVPLSGDGPGMKLSHDPLIGLVIDLRAADGTSLGRRGSGPCGEPKEKKATKSNVLGNLRGTDVEAVFGTRRDDDAGLERYLDRMVWLDETRVAGRGPNVVREYSFSKGRDKEPLNLVQLLEVTGEEELLERHQSRTGYRQVTFYSLLGVSGVFAAAGAATFGATLASVPISDAMGDGVRPVDVQNATFWPSMGLMTVTLVGLTGAFLGPSIAWPLSEDVAEHELRRSVREHNERLRDELGIATRRDGVPTGVPE